MRHVLQILPYTCSGVSHSELYNLTESQWHIYSYLYLSILGMRATSIVLITVEI